MGPLIKKVSLGVSDGLSEDWNEAYKSGDEELLKILTHECWSFRLYCERISLNF